MKQSNSPTPGPASRYQGLLVSRQAIMIIITIVVLGLSAVGTLAMSRQAQLRKAPQAGQSSPAVSPSPRVASQTDAFGREYLQNCQDRPVTFSHSPVALAQLSYIDPLGKVDDERITPADQLYLSALDPQTANDTTDVVMPADGTIIQVEASEDYRVVIVHNCRYVSIFAQLSQLSPNLQAELGGKLKPGETKSISAKLKAGESLGKAGSSPVAWTLADAKTKLKGFVTPSVYDSDAWKIHTIDPLSVYTGALKAALAAKSPRTVEPLGGQIDYDQPGFLIGNWFREGTNGYAGISGANSFDGHLSIAPGNIDPTATILSIGNWAGKAGQYAVKGGLDPATIGPTAEPLAYELVAISYRLPGGQVWPGGAPVKGMTISQTGKVVGTVLLQVQAGEKLKLETFPGKTAAQAKAFTAAARTYAR